MLRIFILSYLIHSKFEGFELIFLLLLGELLNFFLNLIFFSKGGPLEVGNVHRGDH